MYSSIGLIILGWVLNAIAWTIAEPHPINTIFLLSGLFGILAGIVWLIKAYNSK